MLCTRQFCAHQHAPRASFFVSRPRQLCRPPGPRRGAVADPPPAPAPAPPDFLQFAEQLSNLPWHSHPDAVPLPLVSGAGAYMAAVEAGAKKAHQPACQTFKMALLTGGYVGLGCLLMLSVGGNCAGLASSNPGLARLVLGLVGLPSALVIILVAGGDLYTGNTALVTSAAIEGRATRGQLLKTLACSYAGNLLGCLLMVAFVNASGLLATATLPQALATMKTSLPFHQVVVRAIMGNWLVCLAVYLATASTTFSGKVLATFLCIPAFVAIGLEHSIANAFLIPMGIVCGAQITWQQFLFHNLLPVTMGNTLAGTVLVASAYAAIYGKFSDTIKPPVKHLQY